MNHHGQQAHDDVQPVADQQDQNGGDDQRALEAESHVVETLGDGQRRHAHGEQPDIAHDVAEGADGVEEHRKGVAKARFQALGKGLVRSHTAEAHHQQEARNDHAGHGDQIHLLADDQIQYHEIQRVDGGQPAQIGDPAEVFLLQLAPDIHDTGQRQLHRAQNEAELHNGVLLGGGGNIEVRRVVGKKENYDEEISALSSVLAKVEKNGQTGEIDLRNYKVGGDVILKQTKK